MLKGRRVGTLTAGIILVMFGILFLLRLIFPSMSFSKIACFWPLVLVFSGIELIVAYIINNEEKLKYDVSAIILMILLSFFAMGMATIEFIINNFPQFKTIF